MSLFLPGSLRHSSYLKVRDRASYEFALASAAVAFEIEGGLIGSPRIALGGIATKPWRAKRAEAILAGKRPGVEAFRAAAEAELADAKSYGQNGFKIELAKRTLVRALSDLAGGAA